MLAEVGLSCAVVEHLLGLEVVDELCGVLVCPFSAEELSCRYVEERDADGSSAEAQRGEEVVLLYCEDIVAHRHSWCDELCYASLDELVGLLGVLKLLADSYAASVPYEPWEIDIECMVWESCHGVAF